MIRCTKSEMKKGGAIKENTGKSHSSSEKAASDSVNKALLIGKAQLPWPEEGKLNICN